MAVDVPAEPDPSRASQYDRAGLHFPDRTRETAPSATTAGPPAPRRFPPGVLLCVHHVGPGYVVVDKPADLHAAPGRTPEKFDSIESRVRHVFHQATGPITVHRLDLETSGLMVCALNPNVHRLLSRQFMNRRVGKEYTALLDGLVDEDEGAVDLPLAVDWPNRPRQQVDYENGKAARTLFRVLERDPRHGRTRVLFRPITGRTHQLRVNAAVPRTEGGLGCPIVGDSLYDRSPSAFRLMLHASLLGFWEPGSNEWVKFRSQPPF